MIGPVRLGRLGRLAEEQDSPGHGLEWAVRCVALLDDVAHLKSGTALTRCSADPSAGIRGAGGLLAANHWWPPAQPRHLGVGDPAAQLPGRGDDPCSIHPRGRAGVQGRALRYGGRLQAVTGAMSGVLGVGPAGTRAWPFTVLELT